MPEVISFSDVRYRSSQEGDIPATYPGHQTNRIGNLNLYVDQVKWRSRQQVCFSDNLSAAPSIEWEGVPDVVIYGSNSGATTEPFEYLYGYDGGTTWAKFRIPFEGEYSFEFEAYEGDAGFVDTDITNTYFDIYEALVDDPQNFDDLSWIDGGWVGMEFGDVTMFFETGKTYYVHVYNVNYPPEYGSYSLRISTFFDQNTTSSTSTTNLFSPRGWAQGQNTRNTGPVSITYNINILHQGSITFELERTWGGIEPRIRVTTTGGSPIVSDEGPFPTVTFTMSGNDFYKIIVEGVNGTEGGWILKWYMEPPAGDELEDPIDLGSSNSISRTGESTHGAGGFLSSTRFGEEDNFVDIENSATSVWYKWTCLNDGWVTASVLASNDASFMSCFEGDTYDDLIQLAESAFTTNPSINFPVKAGHIYKFRVNSGGEGLTYNLSISNNTTHTPINFSQLTEFAAGSEGSFTTFDIYSSTNPYRKKTTYISFKMKYGNSTKIETDSTEFDVGFGRLNYHTSNFGLYLNDSVRSAESQNNIISIGSYLGYPCTDDDWVLVELIHLTSGSLEFFVGGKYIGTMDGNTTGVKSLDLGYLDDGANRGLDIRYKDVVIRDIYNRDFDYRPQDLPHRILNFEGYENALGKTTTSSYIDWTFYSGPNDTPFTPVRTWDANAWASQGYPIDTDRGRAVRLILGHGLTHFNDGSSSNFLAFSFWIKPESFPTVKSRLADIDNNALIYLGVRPDGNLFVINLGSEAHLKRKLTLNEWTNIEILMDRRWPKTKFTIYVNGEEIFDDIIYRWQLVNDNQLGWPGIIAAGLPNDGTGYIITDVVTGLGWNGPLGAFKTTLLTPTSTVDTNLGGLWTVPAKPNAWIKTSDDGVTWTELTDSDDAHNYVNTFPIMRGYSNDPGDNTKFIGVCNGTGFGSPYEAYWVEFGFEDMPSGDVPVAIKVMQVGRNFPFNVGNYTPSTYSGSGGINIWTTAVVRTNGHELPGSPINLSQLGSFFTGSIRSVNDYEDIHPFDYIGIPWTETAINNLSIRWGYRGGGFAASHEFGTALQGLGIELLMEDNYPAQAEYAVLDPPWIESYSASIYDGSSNQGIGTVAFNPSGCDAYDKRKEPDWSISNIYKLAGIDPYVRGKTPLMFFFYDDDDRTDVEFYWRILPAFDVSYPGWDGDFHDTLADELAGTRSADMLHRWALPTGYDWFGSSSNYGQRSFPDYPPNAEVKKAYPENNGYLYGNYLDSCTLLYDPCWDRLNGKMNPDGTIVIEVYEKDRWGNVSDTTEVTFNFTAGCCGSIVVPIKFRAKQIGDMD